MSNIKNLLDELQSRKIIILGLGREGLSSYKFLRDHFPDKKIFLVDEKPLSDLGQEWQEIVREDHDVMFAKKIDDIEESTKDFASTDNKAIVIKSPGIPPSNTLIKQAKNNNLEISNNTNIFFELAKTIKNLKIIGITGTKGKSTTASMIYHVLKDCGQETFLGGNIGIPALSLWDEIKNSAYEGMGSDGLSLKTIYVVLEMSSHQLCDAKFSPAISVVLDITPEHLDYYKTFEDYVDAKSQITRFQLEEDVVIFDDTKKIPSKLARLGRAEKLSFNFEKNVMNNQIVYQEESIIDLDDLPVIGKHNILNTIPSIIIAKKAGCQTFDINNSLKTFRTLPHRLEIVTNRNKVLFVNDSLSTTPESAIAAIKSFNNSPIILLAGGHDRNLDFSDLAASIINENIKHLILLPDTGKKILDTVKTYNTNLNPDSAIAIKHTLVKNMREPVEIAKSEAKAGDVVLLSPAAASFGHFKDYQDRGDQFRKFVLL